MDVTKQPVDQCPSCGAPALSDLKGGRENAESRFLCSSCGARWADGELERCPECIRWKPRQEFEELIICRSAVGFYVCRACYEKIFK